MHRHFVAATLALVSGLGFALVAAQPAQASYTQCPSQYVCLFAGTEEAGTPIDIVYRSPGTCYTITIAAANNRARSVYNHLGNGHGVQLYYNGNCTDSVHVNCCMGNPIPAGTRTNVNYIDWDKTSSIFFNTG